MGTKLRIKLIKSTIGRKPSHRLTVKALGLRKINSEVIQEKNPAILGMVRKVAYLLEVEEID
ncbi:MAG: 50S ribosomal protein L30 [Spirochaetales bacterium]